eukprot:scaffold43212_cov28-Tisochrysis_lutea.AAC.1
MPHIHTRFCASVRVQEGGLMPHWQLVSVAVFCTCDEVSKTCHVARMVGVITRQGIGTAVGRSQSLCSNIEREIALFLEDEPAVELPVAEQQSAQVHRGNACEGRCQIVAGFARIHRPEQSSESIQCFAHARKWRAASSAGLHSKGFILHGRRLQQRVASAGAARRRPAGAASAQGPPTSNRAISLGHALPLGRVHWRTCSPTTAPSPCSSDRAIRPAACVSHSMGRDCSSAAVRTGEPAAAPVPRAAGCWPALPAEERVAACSLPHAAALPAAPPAALPSLRFAAGLSGPPGDCPPALVLVGSPAGP